MEIILRNPKMDDANSECLWYFHEDNSIVCLKVFDEGASLNMHIISPFSFVY
jgi:hypothetical protein